MNNEHINNLYFTYKFLCRVIYTHYIFNKIFILSLSLMMMAAVRMVTRLRVTRVRMPRMSLTSSLVILTSAASGAGQGRSR